MKASVDFSGEDIAFDLTKPLDISIPVKAGEDAVRAWYLGPVRIEPVMTEQFTGDVNLGGSVNFRNIYFNPHGHGTHTENVGHISKEPYLISDTLKDSFFVAQVITIDPEQMGDDKVITKATLADNIHPEVQAIVIRTNPNPAEKKIRHYSNSNPPYMDTEAMQLINKTQIKHLLIDLPSVDKEHDNGVLACHHVFWNYPENPNTEKTITELIYVSDKVADGIYLLNLQTANFVNDATPSRPVLFPALK